MIKLDFENTTPYFINGEIIWYIDVYFNKYIRTKQAFNLPELQYYLCCIVKNKSEISYVLINDMREVVKDANYNLEGYGQMEAYINILKIAKHFSNGLEF